jgi:hypothetical protein
MPIAWKSNPDEWLSSTDISNVLKEYDQDKLVFTIAGYTGGDFWEYILSNPFEEVYRKRALGAMIVNTGGHWVVLITDFRERSRPRVCYYDSMAECLPAACTTENAIVGLWGKVYGVIRHSESRHYAIENTVRNFKRHQRGGSQCGMFVLMVIDAMMRNVSFQEHCASDLDDQTARAARRTLFFDGRERAMGPSNTRSVSTRSRGSSSKKSPEASSSRTRSPERVGRLTQFLAHDRGRVSEDLHEHGHVALRPRETIDDRAHDGLGITMGYTSPRSTTRSASPPPRASRTPGPSKSRLGQSSSVTWRPVPPPPTPTSRAKNVITDIRTLSRSVEVWIHALGIVAQPIPMTVTGKIRKFFENGLRDTDRGWKQAIEQENAGGARENMRRAQKVWTGSLKRTIANKLCTSPVAGEFIDRILRCTYRTDQNIILGHHAATEGVGAFKLKPCAVCAWAASDHQDTVLDYPGAEGKEVGVTVRLGDKKGASELNRWLREGRVAEIDLLCASSANATHFSTVRGAGRALLVYALAVIASRKKAGTDRYKAVILYSARGGDGVGPIHAAATALGFSPFDVWYVNEKGGCVESPRSYYILRDIGKQKWYGGLAGRVDVGVCPVKVGEGPLCR